MKPTPAPVLFLDGGLGTSLEDKYGIKFDETTPLWSSHLLISDPETLRSCQKDFADIPVDILLTATYQTSIQGFAQTKSSSHPNGIEPSEMLPYLELALSIAEDIKASTAQIALSLGSYGASMIPSQEYTGQYDAEHNSEDQLHHWHRDRLRLFQQINQLDSRVGYIAFETVPRLDEIKAIRKFLTCERSSLSSVTSSGLYAKFPYWISCVFPGDDYTLPDGSTVDQVIEALLSLEISDNVPWGIGINCTKISKVRKLVQMYGNAVSRLVSAGHLRTWPSLILYPDGTNGEVYDTTTKTWQLPASRATAPVTPWEHQLAGIVADLRFQHSWKSIVVGGCCKANHDDIAKLRAAVLQGNESDGTSQP